jgi:NADH-quinone oxidoreductase subunit J
LSWEWITFAALALAAVVSAGLAISLRNALACSMALGVSFVALSGLYALLHAPFVAIIQILVYAGAILVLVVFVIMLLNLPAGDPRLERVTRLRAAVSAAVVLPILPIVLFAIPAAARAGDEGHADLPAGYGGVASVAKSLFTDWVYPFEIVSILLLVAMVAAVVLAKRRI